MVSQNRTPGIPDLSTQYDKKRKRTEDARAHYNKLLSRAGVWEDNDPSLNVKCYDDRPNSISTTTSKNDIRDDEIDNVFGAKNDRAKGN